ncbi:MAG: hypothetical protein IPJ65_20090 [Archangiaceae bacterium]|nr:hypothetical protein [Archangiaceae bacterium]
MSACTNCHVDAAKGVYTQAQLHYSLIDLGVTPTGCSDCHAVSAPVGFVGPPASSPPRNPASGEMRHEAVLWSSGAPGTQALVSTDCRLCHLMPTTDFASTFENSIDGGAPAQYHSSLTAAGQAQPAQCLDCHANTRPVTLVQVGAGLTFDHQAGPALGECKTCHVAAPGTTWAGGQYHAGAPTPTTCLPCHEAERPTSTAGWAAGFTRSPFDYVTNAKGITHGAGGDCQTCHTSTTDWAGANFSHGPSTLAATQCVTCHTTQRPDLLPGTDAGVMGALLGFDHSTSGSGDCFGCHQSTVKGGRYVNLYGPGAMTANNIRGGDWDGGVAYPGSFVSSTDEFITVTQTTLNRSGANNLVTSTSSVLATLYNGMLHTSSIIDARLSPGPTGSPDYNSCWHCHTNTAGTVTAYSNGKYHAALTNFRATPGGTVTPIAQPTTNCGDCHAVMLPQKIVQKGTTNLQPMDHAAQFTATVNIGGQMVSRVSQLDCHHCHANPGNSWADGQFHSKIGSATPTECVGCHYPLMADAAKADVTQGTTFKMSHRSVQLTTQSCATCHTGALGRAAGGLTAAQWRTSATALATYHPNLTAQPGACLDCHAVSQPAAATQGTVSYALAMGMTTTNQAQWMNHASGQLAGKDCSVCHAADAKASGAAWNRAAKFHGPVANATTCRECHGLTNGKGTVAGTNNNLPTGLNDSKTITTASAATGKAGLHDQITHTDINVSGADCKVCHTQQGQSGTAGVTGKEWAQASFHKNITALTLNGTTGRCSNCHLNVKPGTGYTMQDHAAFGATGQDCSSCHAFPGTSATTPNWLGATGAHASTGPTTASALACETCHGQGGSSSRHLSVATAQHYGGIANGNKCVSCHIDFTDFKGPVTNVKYAHTNATANSAAGCQGCHKFASSLYTTLTTTPPLSHPTASGGHQFSQSFSVTGSKSGDSFTSTHNDTNLTLCGNCHKYASTTSTTNVWSFAHDPSNPGISHSKSSSGCNKCH